MKEIEHYVEEITMDLPDDEKRELREEIYGHLREHVQELLVKGYSEDVAIRLAIESFGNKNDLNRELKRSFFPFYKLIRFVWSVIFATVFLSIASYSAMEYYHPEFDNSLPMYSVVMAMFIIAFIAGFGEAGYEALNSKFKLKWLLNPWLFFMFPFLVIGGIQTLLLFMQPEQYQDGLWLDLYTIPIGAFAYIISRQLFTILFVSNKKTKRNMVK
ncbi:permease prefix domain 1-containing protein [Halobacillus sp. MO56]